MKLLSKYKESYDAMLATGVGDLTWIRKPELSPLPDGFIDHVKYRTHYLSLLPGQGTEYHGFFILGNKAYPFVAHALPSNCKDDLRNLLSEAVSGDWKFFFSELLCKQYCKANNLAGDLGYRHDYSDWKSITVENTTSPIGLVFWKTNVHNPKRHVVYVKDMVFSLFTSHNMWSHFSLIEVYQAIFVYLANKTTKENDVVTVENDTRIQQHGFDLKTSFRKSKGK